jgi:hypothetical protein
MKKISFEVLLYGVPYLVKAAPFLFNEEMRFTVAYNNGPEYIFAYDEEMAQYRAIGDEAINIPDNLEEAIAIRLLQEATPKPVK